MMGFGGHLLDFDTHGMCVPAELVRVKVGPRIMDEKLRRTQINIDPAGSNGLPSMLCRHALQETSSLIACCHVDQLNDWLVAIEVEDIYNDRMVEVLFILERKLESARRAAMELTFMKIFCQLLENTRIPFLIG